MVDAMTYEYLIRRAYQCGRYGVSGADADIYRAYERKEIIYRKDKEAIENGTPRIRTGSIDDLAHEAGIASGEIATHLESAIEKVLKDYDNQFNQNQKDILQDCIDKLLSPTKDNIEDAIQRATDVMVEMKIFPQ